MYLSGHNLFPLKHVEQRLEGYYFDAAGSVYSAKAVKGEFSKLTGTRNASGHYYTLNRCSYRADSLLRRAREHRQWSSEMGDDILDRIRTRAEAASRKVSPVATGGTPSNRSYALSMDGAVKSHAVLIASIKDDSLIFGTDPKLHDMESSWKDEMKRLALAVPGTKFVALQIVAAVQVEGLKWE